MTIRGMRHIKTHGTLARAGLLIGVAKNLHRMENRGATAENSGWNVEQYNKGGKPPHQNSWCGGRQNPPRSLRPGSSFFSADDKRIKEYLLEVVQDAVAEMRRAVAEGIPVSAKELTRLENRLSQLKNAAKI